MYHYGLELCRRGYVVLCPDLLGFEDRRPPEYQRAEGTAPDAAMYERFLATRLLLEGSSLKARYTFDLARGLDLLQSLEIVDPERLGVIGHSLGGQETFWLTWYDARVRAGVCSCGLGTLRTILRDQVNHNLAMYLPGLLRVADMDALVAGLAPCPFMLTAGEEDRIFPVDGVRDIAVAAQTAYARAGVPDQFRALLFPGGHGFPQAVREEAYRFLDRWVGRDL
jgi:dienelactone hydrolase